MERYRPTSGINVDTENLGQWILCLQASIFAVILKCSTVRFLRKSLCETWSAQEGETVLHPLEFQVYELERFSKGFLSGSFIVEIKYLFVGLSNW